jgi:hypothetical protein
MPHDDDNEIDSFLSHSGSDRGNGFIGNWKKKKKLNTFMHTARLPLPIWFHPIPKKVVKEDEDGEAVTRVWGGKYVCWEPEAVLKKQYKYNDDNERVLPPVHCPVCLLIEAVRSLVNEQKLGWTQEIFRFEADDEDQTRVIHAGGFIGEFGGDLSDEEKKALKKAGLRLTEVWAENCRAKMNYIFWIVDADNVSGGVQIAQETGLLGDKVKDVIADTMESLGKDKGNPLKNPYCIQWVYNDDEKIPFNKKYGARRVERYELTPEIEDLIRGERPDSSALEKKLDAAELRSILEAACAPDVRKLLPWDECFGRVQPSEAKREERPAAEAGKQDKKPAPEPEGDDETCTCSDGKGGGCGKLIKLSDPRCPHCGLVFDVAAEEPKPEPERQVRSRAEVKADAEKKAGAGGRKGRLPF